MEEEEGLQREGKSHQRSTRSSTPSSAVRTRTRASRGSNLPSNVANVQVEDQGQEESDDKHASDVTQQEEASTPSRQKRGQRGQNVKTAGNSVTSVTVDPLATITAATTSETDSAPVSNEAAQSPGHGITSDTKVVDRVLPVEQETGTEIESKIASTDKQQQQEQLSQQGSNNESHDQGPSQVTTDVDTDDYESMVPIGEVNSQVGRKSTTGQICSLKTLIDDDVLQPGENVLLMDCMGTEFTGDLLPNGYIRWIRTKQVFSTPSSWVNHCKKTLNLDANSSSASASKSAWSTIKYKGKRLDSYKLRWYRKQKRIVSTANLMVENVVDSATVGLFGNASSSGHHNSTDGNNGTGLTAAYNSCRNSSSNQHNSSTSYIANTAAAVVAAAAAAAANSNSNHNVTSNVQGMASSFSDPSHLTSNVSSNFSSATIAAAAALVTAGVPVLSGIDRMVALYSAQTGVHLEQNSVLLGQKLRESNIVDHLTLGTRLNPHFDSSTLVRCSTFPSLDRIQPFSVTVSTNALLLIDFHCHLTANEVTGYLAGSWELSSHSLTIVQAFPCRSRLHDKEKAFAVEEEIRHNLEQRNLSLIGWYHSHPNCPPQPSIKDIEAQLEYQIAMKGESDSSYLPCVGLICSPYDQTLSSSISLDSVFQMYWVMPPPEYRPYEFGKPMHMMYTITRDSFLTQDLLLEMRLLAHFYMDGVDSIKFTREYITSGKDKCVGGSGISPKEKKRKSGASASDASAADAATGTDGNGTTLTNESLECKVRINSTNGNEFQVEKEGEIAGTKEVDGEAGEAADEKKDEAVKVSSQQNDLKNEECSEGSASNSTEKRQAELIEDESKGRVKKLKVEKESDKQSQEKTSSETCDTTKKTPEDTSEESQVSKKTTTSPYEECVDASAGAVSESEEKAERTASVTYWAKLQASLTPNLPRDLQSNEGQTVEQAQVQQQALSHFWAFLRGLLIP